MSDPDDFDALQRAPKVFGSRMFVDKKAVCRPKVLQPWDIPEFTRKNENIETPEGIEEVEVVTLFVTLNGDRIASPDDIKGICHHAVEQRGEPVPGCGVQVTERRCSECGRMLCAAHAYSEGEDGAIFCEDHSASVKRRKQFEAITRALLLVPVTIVWVALTPVFTLLSLFVGSQPFRWWWACYPFRGSNPSKP